MEKRILGYRRRIDELLRAQSGKTDWQLVLEEHLIQVSFFQHERLVHLIVTVTFAVLEMLCICMTIMSFTPFLGILALLLLVLLIPYVRHYYILENEVQKMYDQYDKLLQLSRKSPTV